MFFTQEDYKNIEKYLKLNSMKDTDFPEAEHIFNTDKVTVVQDGFNKILPIHKLSSEIYRNLPDEFITPNKISQSFQTDVIQPMINDAVSDFQNQIDSLAISGYALSNRLGSDPYIGISQKALTRIILQLWDKVSEITGDDIATIKMDVQPNYFISQGTGIVHLKASSAISPDIFEKVTFYVNGEIAIDIHGNPAVATDVDYFECDVELSDTSEIKCVAKILSIEYTAKTTVYKYSDFYIGAGQTYSDVLNGEHAYNVEGGISGEYTIDAEDEDYIFIVMEEGFRPEFNRADMNGFEIPFDESHEDGYAIFTSKNKYLKGAYNIYINR